jgi:hypothetical protein
MEEFKKMRKSFFDKILFQSIYYSISNSIFNLVKITKMKPFLLNNERSIILISSLLGLGYSLWEIGGRFALAFDGVQEPMTELRHILFDLPILAPALMGLLYFRSKTTSKVYRPFAFLAYGGMVALAFYLVKFSTDPLQAGIPMLLIILPFCVGICIFLLLELLRK